MKILHVSPSFGTGGRELRAVELMGRTRAGTSHLVLALDGRLDSLTRLAPGADVTVVREALPTGSFAKRLRRMRALLRELAPDLLLTYNWGSAEWLLAARLERFDRVVHHEDGFGSDEATRQLRRRVWFRRAVFPVCRAIVVPSRTLQSIGSLAWKQPASRLLYLPNGVDVVHFHPARALERREVVFGCVGRVRPEKNARLAVEALARANCRQRARLRIVGDGSDLAATQALAAELGVAAQVDFVGAVTDTAPEYRQMDVFVIPSRTEQMPLALLEAMATGLPVIGTDVGDVKQMVAECNRPWIGDLHEPAAMAAMFDRIEADPGARARLGAANRVHVEREFEIGACYGAYIALYERVGQTSEATVSVERT